MRTKKSYFKFISLLILTLFFISACESNLSSLKNNELKRKETFDVNVKQLIKKTEFSGDLPVIIRVKQITQTDGYLTEPQSLTQRNKIEEAQDSVINNLMQHSPSRFYSDNTNSITKFKTLPYLALKADKEALKILSNDQMVIDIVEDVPIKGTLSQSTQHIKANDSWSRGFSGKGQTVAIIDSGVRSDHQFFSGKIVAEGCFSGAANKSLCPGGARESTASGAGEDCPTYIAGCGHGTHVAGIAAGSYGTLGGVARDANIIAIKTASDPGDNSGVVHYWSDIVRAFEYVYSLRNTYNIASINLSIGGGAYSGTCDDAFGGLLKDAIDMLKSGNIAMITSSGNNLNSSENANSMGAPACITGAISVGNTVGTKTDRTFYNGVHYLTDYIWVDSQISFYTDLLAPGADITSASNSGSTKYESMYGTSMASPHVAGAFAVLRQQDPKASVDKLLKILKTTGHVLKDQRPQGNYSIPRIDVDKALLALMEDNGKPTKPIPVNIPIGISPIDETISVDQPILKWKSTGDTLYVIWLAHVGVDNPIIHNVIRASNSQCDKGESQCSYAIKDLNKGVLTNGNYHWRVRNAGTSNYKDFSPLYSFSVKKGQPSQPGNSKTITARYPTNNLTLNTDTPTFEWSAVSNTIYYVIWVKNTTTNELIAHNVIGSNSANCNNGQTVCRFPISDLGKKLSSGNYEWRVRLADKDKDNTFTDLIVFNVK